MSTPFEIAIGVVMTAVIGVGSLVVVLDTTARREAPEPEAKIECVQKGETTKCIPTKIRTEQVPAVVQPTKEDIGQRIERLDDTISSLMNRLDRIEKKLDQTEKKR